VAANDVFFTPFIGHVGANRGVRGSENHLLNPSVALLHVLRCCGCCAVFRMPSLVNSRASLSRICSDARKDPTGGG